MAVTIGCEECEWTDEVSGGETIRYYCPDCAPDKRVRTTVMDSFEEPDITLSDKA